MTPGQVLGSILVAVVTALSVAFFNNLYEQRRQDRAWKREKGERRTQYKRLRLEEKLRPVEVWVRNVMELAETARLALPSARLSETEMEEFQRTFDSVWGPVESLNREFASISAMVLAIGDPELHRPLEEFYGAWMQLLLTTEDLRALRHPLAQYDVPRYRELVSTFRHEAAHLVEEAALVFSQIESMLEAMGS